MRVIARRTLTNFVEELKGSKDHRAVKTALDAWFYEVAKARWKGPADVLAKYRNASIVGRDRLVFNIKGNSYRLIVAVDYPRQIGFIKWFGTHSAYDKVDVKTVQYGS